MINKAKVSHLKNTYLDADGWYASDTANSDDDGSWLPFGDTDRAHAKKGFTIAAPSLKLTEGPREIKIEFEFSTLNSSFNTATLKDFFSIEHTGRKRLGIYDR